MLATLLVTACANDASEITDAGNSVSTDTSGSLTRLGDFLNSRGERATATALYQRAALQTTDVVEIVRLGKALHSNGATADAITVLRRAMAIDPDNSYTAYELGVALLVQGEANEAINTLRGALDGANRVNCLQALGVALEMSGREEEARDMFEQGLQDDPANLNLLSNLVLSLALSERFDEAQTLAEPIAHSPAANAEHYRNFILVLALANNEKRAAVVGASLMGTEKTGLLLDQAKAARKLETRRQRAMAIGIIPR